jgi:hypothetical protein
MAFGRIGQVWTQKPPAKEKDIASFIAREGLPIWKQTKDKLNELVDALNNGALPIGGVILRFGTGVPTAADPNGSLYVQTDAGAANLVLYYRLAGVWTLIP